MDRQTLLNMFRTMVCIREFETEAIELAKSNATRAAIHTYNGQEAIAVGVCAHMTNKDYITSTHRGHGHCLAKGANLEKMFAELLGREEGYCKGKGGSMHIADLSTGNLGANGIVGGGIPLATGAALSVQLSNSKNFVVSFFGDGATNQGSFHESLNLASIWALPVIYVIENNEYGISTKVSKATNIENLADRAAAYGILGMSVDGNDVVKVYDHMALAIDHVRSGKGPVLVEMKTYRLAGHYFGDNQNYRTRQEVDSWKLKDPIVNCEKRLQMEYAVSSETINQIKAEETEKVLDASAKAKLMSEPDVDDLIEDLYDPDFEEITWIPINNQKK
jgi:acetoin:2,6-dichlorophenolindophenol oxidoreductase subunit alpha